MPIYSILIVDDDTEAFQDYVDMFSDMQKRSNNVFKVDYEPDFDQCLEYLNQQRFDLLILDLRLDGVDEEKGRKVLDEIKQTRFLPIVFYTGLPEKIRDEEKSPVIQVVKRQSGVWEDELPDAVMTALESPFPQITRFLARQIDAVQRDYMWEFMANSLAETTEDSDIGVLKYLMARRLAIWLSDHRRLLADTLPSKSNDNDMIDPERHYIMPVMEGSPPKTGDICVDEDGVYWIVLTPSCDFVLRDSKGKLSPKVEWVLIAEASLLKNTKEYQLWKENLAKGDSKAREKNDKDLYTFLKSPSPNDKKQQNRFRYLPGTLILPDLLIDFQKLTSVDYEVFITWKRIASLDSPFAEALVAQFNQFFGRLGTPDLDFDVVIERLKSQKN